MTSGRADFWRPVLDELSRWQDAGETARLWLRDDDAAADTPALRRLLGYWRTGRVAMLIASIPSRAEEGLARALEDAPGVEIAVHGWTHRNNAPAGEKAQEMHPSLGDDELRVRLAAGLERLGRVAAGRVLPAYVPPWNRIAPEVARLLPALGYRALSTFGAGSVLGEADRLVEINTHLDIIDWKGSRGGRDPVWLTTELARQLSLARAAGGTPIGVLTHHLVHDETAWRFLDDLIAALDGHPAVAWTPFSALAALGARQSSRR